MTFICKVATNLKVGADVELGQKTLIVGPNGSGKSTIINAVELALTGRAGDIAGRVDVGREADVMSLAPAGLIQSVGAVAHFDNGSVARYMTEGSTAKAKKATRQVPAFVGDEVLPLRSLREAVLGSATTARKYLMGKACGETSRNDIRLMLTEQARPLWDRVAATVAADFSAPDTLVSVLEFAGKQQRSASDEAKTARSAAKLVSGEFNTPPSDSEIAAAKSAVVAAREAFAAADSGQRVAAKLAELQAEEARLEALLEPAAAKVQAALKDQKALEAEHEALPKIDGLQAIQTVGKTSQKMGVCLVCNGDVAAVGENMQVLGELIDGIQKAHQNIREAEHLYSEARKEADGIYNKLVEIQRKIGQSEEFLAHHKPLDPQTAEEQLDAAQKRLSDLNAARDNWNVVQRSESVAVDAEKRMAEWKVLKEDCEAAMSVVLDKALADFVAKVQAKLPPTDIFDLRLRDGDREVVQFGLVRNGQLHTALSGAEWARVMAAMAESCVSDDQYACIIPEERAFDPVTLTAVMKALSGCKHQVLIASPVAPKSVPKGWTVVKRGELAKEAGDSSK